MINSVILVGKLVNDPEIREAANGKNVCEVVLATKRPFKSLNGTYDTDFIKVTFWEYLAININEYCSKGATIGVRARLQSRKLNIQDKLYEVIEVVGEQLIFISKAPLKVDQSNDDNDVILEEIKEPSL
ncbi:MAG: single-stranded DNA-binding protein [Acholeplasmatales bacterium]|nr:single-stranded DNA-binding protein [Acholeplasmatales bacterium]